MRGGAAGMHAAVDDRLVVVVVVEGLGDGRLEHGGHGRPRREGEGHLEGVAGGRPEHLQDHPPRRRHFVSYVPTTWWSTRVGASVVLLDRLLVRLSYRLSSACTDEDQPATEHGL